MLKLRPPRLGGLFFVLTAVAAAGCSGQDAPPSAALTVSAGAKAATSATVAPYNMGEADVLTTKTQVLTVTNLGNSAGALQGVTSSDLSLSAPFAEQDSAAQAGIQPCTAGLSLAPGGSCLITVAFSPINTGNFSTTVKVAYTGAAAQGSSAAAPISTAKLDLLATSNLNCQINSELSGAEAQGVKAAQDQMAKDAARGTADGAALTSAQGETDGYNDGYNGGYNAGYHSAAGYDAGHTTGYNDGKSKGLVDPATCAKGNTDGINTGNNNGKNDGSHDGYSDGYKDGFAVGAGTGYNDGYSDGAYKGASDGANSGANDGTAAGKSDGYNKGYADGQTLGYTDGYTDGYAATCPVAGSTGAGGIAVRNSGSNSTPAGPHSGVVARDGDPAAAFTTPCYNQGYAATYDSSAYQKAYDAAKLANKAYQGGYSDGNSKGYAAGVTVGTAKGFADGKAQGEADGFAAGEAIEYTACYNNTYPTAYSSSYKSWYNGTYPTGHADGAHDAYVAAYKVGSSDGYTVGYNSTYQPTYNADYSSAYSAWYSTGHTDGYNAGYVTGYKDGEVAHCGPAASSASMSSQPARIANARALRKVVTPTPVIPAPSIPAKTPMFGKPATDASAPVARKFGAGQAWWTTDNGFGVSTFVASTLPEMFSSQLSAEQIQSFKAMRDLESKGSLRDFLRTLNRSLPLADSGIVKQASPKPAIIK